jgi:protein gp37
MQNTKIQWTDHTVNFWWGCTKVSRACKHCYAETVAKVFGKRLFGTVPEWGAGKPRFERLEAARKESLKLNRKAEKEQRAWAALSKAGVHSGEAEMMPCPDRPLVFVNSMSDWLDDEVPIAWLAALLETLHLCPNVDFQLLTKRPENWRSRLLKVWAAEHRKGAPLSDLCKMTSRWTSNTDPADIPSNVWIGCTVEDQQAADARVPHLLKIPAKVRFLSCEPLVGAIDLRIPQLRGAMDDPRFGGNFKDFNEAIHWVIAGGESGGPAEPSHPDWFRSLRDQCAAARVPFFFKQWGEWLPQDHLEAALHAAFGDSPQSRLQRSYKGQKLDDGTLMLRVGVDTAGHRLEGQEWHQFPEPAAAQ